MVTVTLRLFLEGLKAFALGFCDSCFVFSLGSLCFNAALAIVFNQIALTLDAKFKLFHNWSGFCFSPFYFASFDIILFPIRFGLSLRVSLSTCSRVCFQH